MYKKSLRRLNKVVPISNDDAHKRLDTLRALLLEMENAIHEMENEIDVIGRAWPDLDGPVDFFQAVDQFEIELIRSALRASQGNQARASKLLGLGTTTLNHKIKRYGIVTSSLGRSKEDSRENGRGSCR